MLNNILFQIKKIIPARLFSKLQAPYHYALSFLGALVYRFPSKKIFVVGITGTKGKTSTAELVNAFLETAGYKTALAGTLRFKIGKKSENNTFKMTMPGRFFLQKLLRSAVREKCDFFILEMTSEGTKQSRHKFIQLNSLIFTNLAPEHIEAHGSYENYLEAKLKIAQALEQSPKPNKIIIANADDPNSSRFLNIRVEEKRQYALADARPFELKKGGLSLTLDGQKINSFLSGKFNVYNILAASEFARSQKIETKIIKRALENFSGIRGRVERIDAGQDFTVIVDYAHTPDSLEKLYEAFPDSKRICVLGNTGGGRDKWKRPIMGAIADKYCSQIILTNEDPYDEDPQKIVGEVAEGITKPIYEIIMDRGVAIEKALASATVGDTVLITGKGTDPYIMGPNNTKIEWDDASITRQKIINLLNKKNG